MRSFTQVLGDLNGGRTVAALDETLANLVLAIQSAQKKGKLVLTLNIEPNGEKTVRVVDDIKVTAPMQTRGSSVMYFDEEGSLLVRDPRQIEMPLRRVEDPPSAEPPRRVATSTRPTPVAAAEAVPDAGTYGRP